MKRYFAALKRRGIFPSQTSRQTLVFTPKATSILVFAVAIHLLTAFLVGTLSLLLGVVALIALTPVYFLLFSLVRILLLPIDRALKHIIVSRARLHLAKFPKVTIIGIAGSYGKTTMKSVLHAVLSSSRNTLAPPESINTPLGIARYILKNLTQDTEVLVVEMGEHYPGDIAHLCSITPPDIGIISGINEAHLDRFKSLEKTKKTIYELVENMRPQGLLLGNKDDARVQELLLDTSRVTWYSANTHTTFHQNGSGQTFNLPNLGTIHTTLLGGYASGTIQAATIIAQKLGATPEEILVGIRAIQPIPHRLEPLINQGIITIDDSYNGSPDGVREAIATLAKFTERRRVYITPGLVEMGTKSQEIHERIGEQLARVADQVILIRNSVTPHIEHGMVKQNFDPKKIIWYKDTEEAHEKFKEHIEPGDVILFQNDWTDNYT